jgi:3-deoxy-D-manno-octulosonic-acid transferase
VLTLYSFLTALLSPLILLVFVWRYGLRRTLRGLPERFVLGGSDGSPKPTLWIHAASVGEVRAAESFLRAAPARYPGWPRLLTTTTVNAKELAERLDVAEFVRLAPVDRPGPLGRFVRRWNPRALILVETELWPQWLKGLSENNVPVCVINGRMSDGAFPWYYRLRFFWEPLLATLARAGVQSPTNASRFLQLGALPDAVAITGNLKFDVPLPDPARRAALRALYRVEGDAPVWVAGSTHDGEEEIVLGAFLRLRREGVPLRLVLAPRHVERAGEVRRYAENTGFRAVLRTRLSEGDAPWDLLVLDTVGELADVYGLATVAYVGGSLIARGGQNPLEPARWGVPVLFGPHMTNFREMAKLFEERRAALRVADAESLLAALRDLIASPEKRAALGDAARACADAQRGALEANLALVAEGLASGPRRPRGACGGC